MKLTSLYAQIKPRSDARPTAPRPLVREALGIWFALGLAVLTVSGCAAPAVEAPFVARPDSVARGNLYGPFDGRVVDAASGAPIPNAIVVGVWTTRASFTSAEAQREPVPDGSWQVMTETNGEGRYKLFAPRIPRHRDRWVDRFVLIIYRRDYVAYRSDGRFEDASPRGDFAQSTNVVRLDRFRPELSHREHLRFIGATGELRKDLEPETAATALEPRTDRGVPK